MNTKMYCPICSCEEPITIRIETETYPVKGEPIEIEAKVSYCQKCGNQIWNEEEDSQNLLKAFDSFREKHNLLSSAYIKSIREKYGVSQSVFARALGLGEKTITRYENGSIQDRAHNGLLLLSERPDAFKILVELNKEQLTDAELQTIQLRIESLRAKVISGESEQSTINYSERKQPYVFDSEKTGNYYFGGLNYAG